MSECAIDDKDGLHAADWRPWRPLPLGEGEERSFVRFEENLRREVSEFLTRDCLSDANCGSRADNDEWVEASGDVECFSSRVRCRVRVSDLLGVAACAFGCRPMDGVFAGSEGPLFRHWSHRFVFRLLECFCAAGTVIGGRQLVLSSDNLAGSDGATGVRRKISIVAEPCRIQLEFEIAEADLLSILAPEAASGLERSHAQSEFAPLASTVDRLPVLLEAILADRAVTMSELGAWRLGEQISLTSTPDAPLEVRVERRRLFRCHLAHMDGRLAIQLAGTIDGGDGVGG